MKQRTLFSTLLLLFLTACHKDKEANLPQAETGTFSLNEARAGYKPIPGIKPDWDAAEFINDKSGGHWIVPIPGSLKFQNVSQGYSELSISRDTANINSTQIQDIIPDAQYLLRQRRVSRADFTGRIFIFDDQKQFLSGQIYSQGKRVGTIRPAVAGNGSLHVEYAMPVTSCEWVSNNYVDRDGNAVIFDEQVCTTTIIDYGSTGGGDAPIGIGESGGTAPPVGGGNAPATHPPAVSVSNLPGETKSAINPANFMKCFGNIPDKDAKMKVTLYVQEPFPGTTFNLGPNSVGHVAIGLSKTNGNQSITQVVGFYPNATGLDKMHAPSKVADNGGDLKYNVSISYTVNAKSFADISKYIANAPAVYDLTTFNCTNFVYQACLSGGLTIPDPINTVGLGGPGGIATAMTPAGLGNSIEKLKGQSNVNTNGGTTPISKGACQ